MPIVNVDIEIPEGFEIAPCKQPRLAIEGDLFLDRYGNAAVWSRNYSSVYPNVILRKSKPRYDVLEDGNYVHISALEDAMKLIDSTGRAVDDRTYKALKEVLV